MEKNTWKLIVETLRKIGVVEEKFRKIQENPVLYGQKYGLTAEEQEILEKLIEDCGASAIAATEISRRA